MSCVRVLQKQVHHTLITLLHVARALWAMLVDMGKHLRKLARGRASEAQPHRPYFAQMARTSASVA